MATEPDQSAAPEQPAGRSPSTGDARIGRSWFILVALALGVAMDAFDATVVSVANPSIAADLQTSLPELQWVANGYLLATAVFLITAGKLGDRFGHKRIFLMGLAGFSVSSVLVGLSTNIELLILWRVLQGACGSVLMPTGLALVSFVFPPDKVKMAIGTFTGSFALFAAAGPVLGGVVVEYAGWQWAFFLNVFIGAASFVLVSVLVPRLKAEGAARPFDVPGIALLTVFLLGLVWGVIEVPAYGWGGAYPLIGFGAAVVSGALFVLRERSTSGPLIPPRLFAIPTVAAGTVILFIAGGLMYATYFYVALYMQEIRSATPLEAGLGLILVPVSFAVGAPLGGALNQRFGPRFAVAVGLLFLGVSMFGLSRLVIGASYAAVWPFVLALGLGSGLVAPTATQAVIAYAPRELTGITSGITQTAQFVGAVFGIATLGSLISARVNSALPGLLGSAGVTGPTADRVAEARTVIAQGVVPVPPGTPDSAVPAITSAAHAAFMTGFRFATLVGAIVVVAAILLVPLVRAVPSAAHDAPGGRPVAG
ncbi:MAG TPA: MFS transporter [Actinophytocola sp.]|jgi:EmrB/QacA subfamily drug resistance transporter|uniref:MFS transporter n=1 Tax=Actinophytocola sp. TaxID=1872138 RepID=UPI002E04DF25|nr:MFS transporter [Actinophytocola sp.]